MKLNAGCIESTFLIYLQFMLVSASSCIYVGHNLTCIKNLSTYITLYLKLVQFIVVYMVYEDKLSYFLHLISGLLLDQYEID